MSALIVGSDPASSHRTNRSASSQAIDRVPVCSRDRLATTGQQLRDAGVAQFAERLAHQRLRPRLARPRHAEVPHVDAAAGRLDEPRRRLEPAGCPGRIVAQGPIPALDQRHRAGLLPQGAGRSGQSFAALGGLHLGVVGHVVHEAISLEEALECRVDGLEDRAGAVVTRPAEDAAGQPRVRLQRGQQRLDGRVALGDHIADDSRRRRDRPRRSGSSGATWI